MSREAVVFGIICALVVIGYIAYVVRASRQRRLNFRGQPDVVAPVPGDMLGGCVYAVLALVAILAGLFGLIWIIKRVWGAA